jgi:hypothetical protein
MSERRVVSVGNRRDYPREAWGRRDHEREREEMDRMGAPLHAPGGPPPELKFSLFPERIVGGTWSKAVDELVARHTGKRPRSRR